MAHLKLLWVFLTYIYLNFFFLAKKKVIHDSEKSWFSSLDNSGWLHVVSKLLKNAVYVADLMVKNSQTVIIKGTPIVFTCISIQKIICVAFSLIAFSLMLICRGETMGGERAMTLPQVEPCFAQLALYKFLNFI